MIIIGHHPPDISIHALRKESDRMIVTDSTIEYAFQSTLSVRRATGCCNAQAFPSRNFNPRSP